MESLGRPLTFPLVNSAALSTTDVVNSRVSGDAADRFVLNADGSMEWGDGTNPTDITLSRIASTAMRIAQASLGMTLQISGQAGNVRDVAFMTNGSNRYILRCDGTAESGGNAGSNLNLFTRDDTGAALRTDLVIARSTGVWTIGGQILAGTDNSFDLGTSDAGRFRQLFLAAPSLTKGSGTGYTLSNSGSVRGQTFRCVIDYTALAAAALTADKTVCTLPAKTRIKAVYADVTTKFLGGAISAATLKLGSTAGGVEILASFDCFTAAITRGLADADMGTSLTRAAAIQGGYLPSFTATTTVTLRLTTVTANTNACTQGSVTITIEYEILY